MIREVQILEELTGIVGIPQVLDYGVSKSGAECFLVLDWIDGKTVADHYQAAVSIDDSARIVLNLCRILQECHKRGVVHRDIKQNNILIEARSGDVWLIDFGISWQEIEDDSLATDPSQDLGNRLLWLPELHSHRSESKRDPRSDITFACGVFFWLLTHTRPGMLYNQYSEPPHKARYDRFP